MKYYIDKSALVAEIEKMIADETESIKSFEHGKNVSEVQRSNVRIDMLMHIRSLIDTIEVKEVDLEKEIQEVHKHFHDYYGIVNSDTNEFAKVDDIIHIVKHFFELGLKVERKKH